MSTRRGKDAEADLDRRRFLGKAAVAGGTVWAVPTLVSMRPAGAAELTSSPPVTATTETSIAPNTSTPSTVARNTAPDPAPPGPSTGNNEPSGTSNGDPTGGGPATAGSLPRTGADLDTLAATGLTAIAAGGALTYWSATRTPDLATPTSAASADPGPDDIQTSPSS
ncbi:MAG: twin-arginine translocation signal domain-containing protein [Acidimicrobiales bacterium]